MKLWAEDRGNGKGYGGNAQDEKGVARRKMEKRARDRKKADR